MPNNVSAVEAKFVALQKGVQTVLPAGGTLMVEGQPLTQAQIAAKLGTYVSLFASATSAKTQATATVAALHAALPEGRQFAAALTTSLKTFFGSRAPQLPEFGIALPKARQAPSAARKAVAAAKASATRKARGTLGVKQRAAIPPVTSVQLTIGTDGKPAQTAPVGSAAASTPAPAPASTAAPVAVVNVTPAPVAGVAPTGSGK